jgi:lambda repressor-like predicted transcriptional regulator
MEQPLHREDIKAELRKRFGSVAAFEREKNLPNKSVHEILRGRKSARVAAEIEKALTQPLPQAENDISYKQTAECGA